MNAVEIIIWIIYIITLYLSIFWLLTFIDMKEEKVKKRLKYFPLVTIVVPAYNEEKTITKTMDSVINLDYPKDKIELIVVNDGSRDRTQQLVEKFIKGHRERKIILINQKNSGKWVCLNRGLRIARGEFFACLDADSFVNRHALKRMLLYFEDKKTAAVLPLMKVKNPKNTLQKIQWYEYLVNMFYKKIASYLNCVHVTPGPFSLYRTDVLRKVGGFKYGFATEDLEIALRLQKNNYRIVQVTDAEVYTIAPDNLKAFYKQRNRWNKGSILNVWNYKKMMFNRKYGDFAMIQMPAVLIAGFLSVSLISVILYYGVLKPLYKLFLRIFLVRFDVMTLIKNLNLNLNILDINFYKLGIAVFALTLAIVMFVIAHSHTKERMVKYGITPLITYLFIYYILLGMIWIGIMKDLIVGKVRSRW